MMSDGQLKVSQLQSVTERDTAILIENQYDLNHKMQTNDSQWSSASCRQKCLECNTTAKS
jgi:hypothetical protein